MTVLLRNVGRCDDKTITRNSFLSDACSADELSGEQESALSYHRQIHGDMEECDHHNLQDTAELCWAE